MLGYLTHLIKNFTHWIIWNLPAKEIIKKAIPSGSNIGLYELFNKRIKKK